MTAGLWLELALDLALVVGAIAVCVVLHRAHARDRERWRRIEREGDLLYAAALLAMLRELERRTREKGDRKP